MNNTSEPYKVGDIVAKVGAWQRKYRVEGIVYGSEPWAGILHNYAIVRLRKVGDYWATRDIWKPAPKAIERELKVHVYNTEEKLMDIPWYSRTDLPKQAK